MEKQFEYPLISIAICTYNGSLYIKKQIDSILNQTYKNIEIVVVDDDSTDNTYQILNEYAALYSQIKLTKNNENLGFNKNFEKAISLCTGSYIAISDQDDIWIFEKLQVLYDSIKDYGLIYSNSKLIDSDGNDLNRLLEKRNLYKGNDSRFFILGNIASGHTMLIKREMLSVFLPIPENVVYDWWFALVAANYGQLNSVNEVLTFHRRHGNNASKDFYSKSREQEFMDIESILSKILLLENLQHRSFFESLYMKMLSRKTKLGYFRLFLFFIVNANILMGLQQKKFYKNINRVRKLFF